MTRVEEKSLRIVFAADARYAMPLSVAMSSAALNCDPRRDITFYVLQCDIGPHLRQRVEKSLTRTGRSNTRVVWLDVSLRDLKQFKTHGHLNAMTYARLLIQWLIPPEVERVLYLDSDLVVVGDLAELWDLKCGNQTLLAVQDRIVGSVNGPLGLSNYRELGIPEGTKYFNAGVLLIDLRKWRADNVSDAVFEYLRTHREIIQMVDQEALNAVLFNSWGQLEYRWNWQVGWWSLFPDEKAKCVPVEKDVKPTIIHFTTRAKPWVPRFEYEERQTFFEYLDRTDWAGWRVPLSHEAIANCWAGVQAVKRALRRLCAGALREIRPRCAELK